MNWVDFTIIGVIVFSALASVVRGFVKEALSLVSWILAFLVASHFYYRITPYLTYFDSDLVRNAAAMIILFIATLLVCSIINYIIGEIVQKTGLSGTDRVLGVCFGILRGILIVAAVLFFVDTFTPLSKSQFWTESKLIPHFHFLIRWFFDYLQSTSSFLTH
ncbi:CvpA family protein [Orbaceae bacterium ESL0721]|nr:CvpA family protein [Orbaceae bacterium ESL0721]